MCLFVNAAQCFPYLSLTKHFRLAVPEIYHQLLYFTRIGKIVKGVWLWRINGRLLTGNDGVLGAQIFRQYREVFTP